MSRTNVYFSGRKASAQSVKLANETCQEGVSIEKFRQEVAMFELIHLTTEFSETVQNVGGTARKTMLLHNAIADVLQYLVDVNYSW